MVSWQAQRTPRLVYLWLDGNWRCSRPGILFFGVFDEPTAHPQPMKMVSVRNDSSRYYGSFGEHRSQEICRTFARYFSMWLGNVSGNANGLLQLRIYAQAETLPLARECAVVKLKKAAGSIFPPP